MNSKKANKEDFFGIELGHHVSFSKEILKSDIEKYKEVSGDTNRLHYDVSYASRTRFGRPIAHGMLSASVISAAIGTKLAPDSVPVYLSQNLKFIRPVFAGDVITATITVTDISADKNIVCLDTIVGNQEGIIVIRGSATIMLDELNP